MFAGMRRFLLPFHCVCIGNNAANHSIDDQIRCYIEKVHDKLISNAWDMKQPLFSATNIPPALLLLYHKTQKGAFSFHQRAVVFQCCEVVVKGLGAADELDAAVRAQEKLGAPEFAVVVESHRAAVRARVVDDDDVADVDLREGAVDGKLVVVLAE